MPILITSIFFFRSDKISTIILPKPPFKVCSSRVIILSCEMSGEDQEYYLGKRLIASKTSVKEIKNG